MGENMPDCVGASNGLPTQWSSAPYNFDIYNLAAAAIKQQQSQQQQLNAYQHHVQQYALDRLNKQQQTKPINAPPGFSNIDPRSGPPLPPATLMDLKVPPPPSFHQQQIQQQSPNAKQFGGIRFNLSQQKRLQSSPLANNGTASTINAIHAQVQQPNLNASGNGKKKRKNKNKNKQNQQQQQQQPHQQQNNTTSPMNGMSPSFPDMSFPPPALAQNPDITIPPPPMLTNNFSPQNQSIYPLSTTPSPSYSNSPNQNTLNSATKMPNPYNNPTDAWPDSLNRYVQRCYAKCKTDFDKDQIQIILKGRITQSANRDELWIKDWDAEPTPSVYSDRNNVMIPKAPVPGQLANFQNKTAATTPKKGISQSLGQRLGNRGNKRSSRSRSRSRSNSPYTSSNSRKRRSRSSSKSSDDSRTPRRKNRRTSTSTSSNDDNYKSLSKSVSKKMSSRLGLCASSSLQSSKKKNKQGNKKKYNGALLGDIVSDAVRLQQRAARFTDKKTHSPSYSLSTSNKKRKSMQSRLFIDDNAENNFDLSDFHIIGTCRDIEKSFLRLTKAPEAHEVRPVEVLKFSLANAKDKWIEKRDYFYACDQLKSIRQDLTVSQPFFKSMACCILEHHLTKSFSFFFFG